jgi:hypothetical protein
MQRSFTPAACRACDRFAGEAVRLIQRLEQSGQLLLDGRSAHLLGFDVGETCSARMPLSCKPFSLRQSAELGDSRHIGRARAVVSD